MLKRLPLILLAAAIGCTQAGVPEASKTPLQLPDASATLVQFYSPGMT